ncbi:chromate efflux transporter [Candidatus Woesearchaeota archaeon]|nr:chromate efflux transporter [Candidatus Woesearchaeota archaeon]
MKCWDLFLRFLKLSTIGFGGPLGRIAVLHRELVYKEKWISEQHFGKILALYQALPGPEATELAVYFGYKQRGFWGGIMAGLGFMSLGFLLTVLVSWLYTQGVQLQWTKGFLYGVQPAVVALILREGYRMGKMNLTRVTHLVLFAISLVFSLMGINFLWILLGAGLVTMAARRAYPVLFIVPFGSMSLPFFLVLFLVSLKAGLFTYGGAYSVVSFMHHDAVETYHWLTPQQFLDGLALVNIIPVPLSMIGTFVGFLTGGLVGAMLMTIGIFLPAFAFTLCGFRTIEHMVENPGWQAFLEGLVAATVGLIAATWIQVARIALVDSFTSAMAILLALLFFSEKMPVHYGIFGSGILGLLWKLV